MNEVWMLYYLDHDGRHPVDLFSDESKALYFKNLIKSGENPLSPGNSWHNEVGNEWFNSNLHVDRYEVY